MERLTGAYRKPIYEDKIGFGQNSRQLEIKGGAQAGTSDVQIEDDSLRAKLTPRSEVHLLSPRSFLPRQTSCSLQIVYP